MEKVAISYKTLFWLGDLAGVNPRQLAARFNLGQLQTCNLPRSVTLPNGVMVFGRSFDMATGRCVHIWNSQTAIPGAPT